MGCTLVSHVAPFQLRGGRKTLAPASALLARDLWTQFEPERATVRGRQGHDRWLMEAQVESDRDRRVPSAATLENPPGDDKCGTGWELPELKQSLEKVGANKVPFNTCSFQQKLKVRHFKPAMWAGKLEGLASLSRVCRCPAWIIHEPLIGKSKTVKAGRYPDELCEAVAKLVVAGWKRTIKLEFWRHQLSRQESGIGTSTQMVVERGEEVR